MARHNREGRGVDQLGHEYIVEYQPDWLYQVKVTRDLESGRQSTKTLFRNPEPPLAEPGPRVRTRIVSEELGIDVEVVVADDSTPIRKVIVEAVIPQGAEKGEKVGFSISRVRSRPGPQEQ